MNMDYPSHIKVTKLLQILTEYLRDIVLEKLKELCSNGNEHQIESLKKNIRVQTTDHNDLAKHCLTKPLLKSFNGLEDCHDPNVFLNILRQRTLFPGVWENAGRMLEIRNLWGHELTNQELWTEGKLDEVFGEAIELVKKLPESTEGKQKDTLFEIKNLVNELPGVVQRYKSFVKDNSSSRCRMKLDQVKEIYHPQRFVNKRKGEKIHLEAKKPTELDLEALTKNLKKKETSFIEGDSGDGKSTTAAKITELWTENKLNDYDVCIHLSEKTKFKIALSKIIWQPFELSDHDHHEEIFKELKKLGDRVLVLIDSLDELSLKKSLLDSGISKSPRTEISYEELVANLLAKNILPEATVLGFTRSADIVRKNIPRSSGDIYQIQKMTEEEIEKMLNKICEDGTKAKRIKKIICSYRSEKSIFFIREAIQVQLSGKIGKEKFRTESEFRLHKLLQNLHFNNEDKIEPFTLLSSEDQKDFETLAEMCRSQILMEEINQVEFEGSKIRNRENGEIYWKLELDSAHSTEPPKISMEFLKKIGIFQLTEETAGYSGRLTLTALHLSYVEFMAAIAFLPVDEISEELLKVPNNERFKAIVEYLR